MDLFAFEGPPQARDEDIAPPSAFAIHGSA